MSRRLGLIPQKKSPKHAPHALHKAAKESFAWKLFILRALGNFFILFSLFGISMTLGPALFYEARYQLDTYTGVHYVVSQDIADGLKNVQTNQKILTPPDTYFSIVIPKIGAASRVIINVDPNNPDDYLPALQKGIAHAKGSVFPGDNGTAFFFSHSTDNFWDVGRYNAIFYLLKDMQIGDKVIIYFKNYRYNYAVTSTEITDPNDVSLLVNAQSNKTQQIVLQTCWPPGTTWKRFLVIAKPVKT